MPTDPLEPPKRAWRLLDAIAFWFLLLVIGPVVVWLAIVASLAR